MDFALELIRDTVIAGSLGVIFGIIVKFLKKKEEKR